MIDALDKKILAELSMNCRQSVNQIARKLKKSKNTILYRIKRLEEDKVILKYQAVIDYPKIGLSYARFALKLYNNSRAEHEKAIDFLLKEKNISWLGSAQGQMDIIFVFMYHDVTELARMSEGIRTALGKNVENIHLSILYRLYHCNNNIITTKSVSPVIMDYSSISNMTDDLDMKIISILNKDARTGIVEIAKLAGCNDKTILYRIRRLQKNKVVLRYGIELDPAKFDRESYHLFWDFYNMDLQTSNRFRKYLLEMDETTYISETIGSISSFESDILVKNSTELYETVNKLKERFPELIKGFNPMIILKVHKAF